MDPKATEKNNRKKPATATDKPAEALPVSSTSEPVAAPSGEHVEPSGEHVDSAAPSSTESTSSESTGENKPSPAGAAETALEAMNGPDLVAKRRALLAEIEAIKATVESVEGEIAKRALALATAKGKKSAEVKLDGVTFRTRVYKATETTPERVVLVEPRTAEAVELS